ncbi:MAG: hypothetical protein JWO08_2691 [Verrucomicrobiaceae bacterium]|nr:hypothetical protein [Verrucomicrobiaceae bacterium]
MPRLRAILCHLGALFAGAVFGVQPATRLYINYSRTPPPQDLLAYDLCVLDPHAKADLHPGQALGHRFLAYVSLVEVAKGSPADAAAQKRGVPHLGTNEAWASTVMDVTSAAWRAFILEDAAAVALDKGYDGLFLDTADTVSHSGFKDKARARQAVIDMVKALHQRWPGKQIILNRGFDMLPDLATALNGVMVEGVYQDFDPETKHYRAVPAAGSQWVVARIKEAQALKLPVYAVDYVSPANIKLAGATLKRLQALNCVGLITTPELTGTILAPIAKP